MWLPSLARPLLPPGSRPVLPATFPVYFPAYVTLFPFSAHLLSHLPSQLLALLPTFLRKRKASTERTATDSHLYTTPIFPLPHFCYCRLALCSQLSKSCHFFLSGILISLSLWTFPIPARYNLILLQAPFNLLFSSIATSPHFSSFPLQQSSVK